MSFAVTRNFTSKKFFLLIDTKFAHFVMKVFFLKKMPKIDTLDALEEHEEH